MGKSGLVLCALLALTEVGVEAETVGRSAPIASSRWVEVDGVRVHYLERPGTLGAGSTTLLLIHGWLGSSFDYSQLLPRLSPRYRVIAVDLPGSGRSQQAGIDYAPGLFEGFLSRFAATVGIDRAVVVGHSMGGAIAVRLAIADPELVERLILIDPFGLAGEEGVLGHIRRSRFLVSLGMALNNRLAIRIATKVVVFHNPRLVTKAYVESIAESCLTRAGRRAQTAVTTEILGRVPVDALLPKVESDTLIIWGSDDRVLNPSWAERFAELLPSSEVAFVANSGHLPQFEAPRAVAGLIDTFAGSQPSWR